MTRRAALVLLATLSPAPLAAQGLYYEGGMSAATGRYIFAERTTSWGISTGFSVGTSSLTFRAALPVYLQNSTLIAVSSPGGGLPTGGSSSGAVADSGAARKGRGGRAAAFLLATTDSPVDVPSSALTGYRTALGDPTMQVAWRAIDAGGTSVTASVLAKAPVADTATFGTGEWDVGGSLAAHRWIGRSLVLGVEGAYWHLGDLPTLSFRDPISGGASMTYRGSGGWGGGLSVSASSSALEGYPGPAWVGVHLLRSSEGGGWGLNAALGLSETTPDVSVGLTWRVRLAGGN